MLTTINLDLLLRWETMPYADEILPLEAYILRIYYGLELTAKKQMIAGLIDELSDAYGEMDELTRELNKADLPADLRVKAKHVLTLLELDKGDTLREMANALQTLSYDATERCAKDWKGEVNVKLKASLDSNDWDVMIVESEIAPKLSPNRFGGRLSNRATDGELIPSKEAAKAFQMKLYDDGKEQAA